MRAWVRIGALGRVPDVRRCVTTDLKEPGNLLYLIGTTRDEMGGSHYNLVASREGGSPPRVDLGAAPRLFRKLHEAMQRGLVRSCHDLSEGGLAAAAAEMALAGNVGADLTGLGATGPGLPDEVLLFSESNTPFLVEVAPANGPALEALFGSEGPLARVGQTVAERRLRIAGAGGEWLIWATLVDLKEAWQKPLRW